ncbi:MAG: RagB/SusD family nutrient uptake outer membrane protein, partial [Prevotella sp.]
MKKILTAAFLVATTLTACNDQFLEKYPLTDLTEENAFKEYDNFKAFMNPCYGMFINTTIQTSINSSYMNAQFAGDWFGGLVTHRDNARNPYAYQTVTATSDGGGWDFSYIRRINIMLSHLGDGVLTEAQAAHWRSVGYFFSAYWYMELIDRFGDVPWVNKVLDESSPESYGPRTPRAAVADSIIARLEYAAANIGSFNDGDNTITANAIKAALSRFLLREGTWAKYHGLNEPYETYLQKCLTVSQELMDAYPGLYLGVDKQNTPATGYGELWTTESLKGKPGVIFYKEFVNNVLMNRYNDFEHIAANAADVPQYTVDMFLMKNGLPIANAASGYQGGKGKDMWATFAQRDPRLYQNIQPPYVVAPYKGVPDNVNTFKTWRFLKAGDNNQGHIVTADEAAKYRYYIDYMGLNDKCLRGGAAGGEGMKRCPGQNWGASLTPVSPNLTTDSRVPFMRCRTGYYFWKNYDMWEFSTGSSAFCTADKPIFKIEEVLLNYAEAAWELQQFDQAVADKTINKLRERADVAHMVVADINDNFDPNRDKGNAPWWTGNGGKFGNYNVDPVLWEIRRERQIELFGEGFAFYDVRRWAKAAYYVNRQPCGLWTTAADNIYAPKANAYTGQFVDYDEIVANGKAAAENNTAGSGWIYTYESPLAHGGWLDTYYLSMVPTSQIVLNKQLTQN